jgi:putative SOS response-associated peptidase YedK
MSYVPWIWLHCTNYRCGHARAVPFAPWAIRWGEENLGDIMRRNFYCSMCGRHGANFTHPGVEHGTLHVHAFPVDRFIRFGGDRKIPESCIDQETRCHAEYLTRYPSGDALSEFRGGPPGPAQMCGKFTAMSSWAEVVSFSQPLTRDDVNETDNDRTITFRVMSNLPVIIWDQEADKRRVVPMRWGWPDPKNWKVPRPIHARAETIDDPKKPFARPFATGQRGIVIVKTFNEAPDVPGKSDQHTITPGDSGAIGIAFVWRQFDLADLPGMIRACVMVTVPANALIATLPTDRMPAVLADEDWAKWLGEESAPLDDVKACLKTVEGVRWTMTKEERAASAKRGKPTVRDPGGLS